MTATTASALDCVRWLVNSAPNSLPQERWRWGASSVSSQIQFKPRSSLPIVLNCQRAQVTTLHTAGSTACGRWPHDLVSPRAQCTGGTVMPPLCQCTAHRPCPTHTHSRRSHKPANPNSSRAAPRLQHCRPCLQYTHPPAPFSRAGRGQLQLQQLCVVLLTHLGTGRHALWPPDEGRQQHRVPGGSVALEPRPAWVGAVVTGVRCVARLLAIKQSERCWLALVCAWVLGALCHSWE